MRKAISILTIMLFLSIIFSAGTTKVKAEDKSYEMMKAYYDVVNTIVNGDKKDNKGIGVYTSGENNPRNASGLVYANLIDFDGNGNKELFCFYLDNGSYVYEICGFDGKAYKIQSIKDTTFYPLRATKVVSLATVDNKTYIHDNNYSYGLAGIQSTSTDVFNTVINNKLIEVEKLNAKSKLSVQDIQSFESKGLEPPEEGTEGNPIVYTDTKDGENQEISKSEYESALQKYAGGTKTNLISLALGGAGTVDIGVDASQGNKQLGDFLSNLSKMVMESSGLKDVYNTKTNEYRNTLGEFMNIFVPDKRWHVNSFDASNFTKGTFDDQIIFFLYRYGRIAAIKTEKNNDTGKDCWVIPLDKLDEYCGKFFGTKIDANNKNVHNGNYYLDIGNDDEGEETGKTDNQIVSVYQIADNIYCLNLNISTSYSYRQLYKTGYAIVKEVTIDGKKTFQLLKYSNDGDMLTPDQLQAYKKQYNPEKVTNSASSVVNNNVGSSSANIAVYCVIAVLAIAGVGCGIYYKARKNKKNEVIKYEKK